LHEYRLGVSSTNSTIKKKRPLTEIQTTSGQYKRFSLLSKESEKEINSLIKKHNMVDKDNQPIVHLQRIELDFNGESVILNFKQSDKKNEYNKIDAIVKACDESLLA
jgi:hypothetical protein